MSTGGAEEIFRFGRRIAEEMDRIGLKQKQFATRIAVSDRTLRSWLSDQTAPDLRDLKMMEEAGCDIWYIFSGEKGLLVGQSKPPYTAAERAAAIIASLTLSERDADRLADLAVRFAE